MASRSFLITYLVIRFQTLLINRRKKLRFSFVLSDLIVLAIYCQLIWSSKGHTPSHYPDVESCRQIEMRYFLERLSSEVSRSLRSSWKIPGLSSRSTFRYFLPLSRVVNSACLSCLQTIKRKWPLLLTWRIFDPSFLIHGSFSFQDMTHLSLCQMSPASTLWWRQLCPQAVWVFPR